MQWISVYAIIIAKKGNKHLKNNHISLYEKLKQLRKQKIMPMHMPGHKRKSNYLAKDLPYHLDITEIDGFDNLHGATGILKQTHQKIERLFMSKHSYMLVNGSTGGLLAAIRAATNYGDTILLGRNAHKSVYHAIELNGLQPIYLLPSTDEESGILGSIEPSQVQKMVEKNPNIKAILITSPTYEGVISDIAGIATIAHRHGVPLIVDEAHGAHLFLSNRSAVVCGADIVINSTHKTLPSLTQTAVAHFNSSLICRTKFEKNLAIFQTSSPSYILMASMDACMDLLKQSKKKLHQNHKKFLALFEKEVVSLQHLFVLGIGKNKSHQNFFDLDETKLVICTQRSNISGTQLMEKLRRDYRIELEMAYLSHAVAISTMFDSKKNLISLAKALKSIDQTLEERKIEQTQVVSIPPFVCSPAEVITLQTTLCALEDAEGSVVAEYVWAYPPGIPLLVPGEEISKEMINALREFLLSQTTLHSTSGNMPGKLQIVAKK